MSRADSTFGNTFHVNPHVAKRLYDRYTSALSQVRNAASKDSSSSLPSPITSLQLQTLIEVSFWASLIQEEGQYHDFSLTLCPQEFAADSFVFESRVPFQAAQLAKLAPALAPQENSIGVWLDEHDEWFIWGFTPSAGISLAVRTHEPGELLVSFDFGVAGFTAFNKGPLTSHQQRSAREDADQSLEVIGKLTAVDGATLVTFDLDVLAFGAKIRAKNVDHKPERLLISEPFEGSVAREIGLSELGGTRHQSAAQFVFDQKDAIAIVASQDGGLSVLGWDRTEGKVAIIHPAQFVLL